MNHNPYREDKLGFEEAGGQEQELGDSGILEPAGVTVFTVQLDQKVIFSEKECFFKLSVSAFWIFRLNQQKRMCFSNLDEKVHTLHGQPATSHLLLKSAPAPRLSPARARSGAAVQERNAPGFLQGAR